MAQLNISVLPTVQGREPRDTFRIALTHSTINADAAHAETALLSLNAPSAFGTSTVPIETSLATTVDAAEPKSIPHSLATIRALTTEPRSSVAFITTAWPTTATIPTSLSVITTFATVTITAAVNTSTPIVGASAVAHRKTFHATPKQDAQMRNALLVAGALLLLGIGAFLFQSCCRRKAHRATRKPDNEETERLTLRGAEPASVQSSERTLFAGMARGSSGQIGFAIRHDDTVEAAQLSLRGGGAICADGEDTDSKSSYINDDTTSESADDSISELTDYSNEVILGDAEKGANECVHDFVSEVANILDEVALGNADRPVDTALHGAAKEARQGAANGPPQVANPRRTCVPSIRITPASPGLGPTKPPPIPVAKCLMRQRLVQHHRLSGIDRTRLWALPLTVALQERWAARRRAAREAQRAMTEGLARAALDQVARMSLADYAARYLSWRARPTTAFLRYLARGPAALERLVEEHGGVEGCWPRIVLLGDTEVRAPVEMWGELAAWFKERMQARIEAEEAEGNDCMRLLQYYMWLESSQWTMMRR